MLDKMNARERVMVIAILVLVPICLLPLAGLFAWNSLDDKKDRLEGLLNRQGNLELNKRRWMNAELVRNDLRALSLPGDAEQASSEYRNWLLSLGTDVFGESAVRVQHTGDVSKKNNDFEVYRQGRFTMDTEGTLAQLLEFMEAFYEVDCLHRISNLSVIPKKNLQTQQPSKTLTLKFTFEALAVSGAEEERDIRKKAEIQDDSLRQHVPDRFAEWKDRILMRNVFGFPNEAPRFSRVGTKRFVKGEQVEVRLSARDSDDGDLLVFEIEQSPMQGAKIEQKEGEDSATLTTPDLEVGSYTFVVAVKDDGYPSKIDRQEFEIEIEEPEEEVVEEPEPEFDPSLATYITGVVRNTQGVEQVFIHVKPTGELLRLAVGEAFEIGTIQGIVVLISEGKAVLEVNGEEQEFRPGQKLNAVSSRRSRR